MSDAASIRSCVETIRSQGIRFNVLVNNAGVSLIPNYTEAPTGQELTCQTNYFGVVQLTESLIPLLEGDARVIFVSSLTYNKGAPDTIDRTHLCIGQEAYDKWSPYFRSKYLVTSYAQYLARRNPSLFVIACDPGIAGTAIARELGCIGKIFQWKICQCLFPTWKVAMGGESEE
ncbi:uncharacterized protein [Blastocystis hominis]|uniref:Uncharacterized protein n=1 Tax=Blastocystis hominis TaxID=12968 RepID=D8LZ83_BLAHO|nr:uncharacterized protein [Blastocystis hominis]CBK21122.2 unnamed protein product [Blastocystis hominis]|eukprot:XP_012895170.1 uncharacterized protein [Blastocystis hominis]